MGELILEKAYLFVEERSHSGTGDMIRGQTSKTHSQGLLSGIEGSLGIKEKYQAL